MKPIDFDAHYAEFAEQWIRENMAKYKTIDEMEQHLPEIYLRFMNQSADWLSGKTPAEYFAQFTDADELVALLCEYEKEDIDVPDLLLERIVDMGAGASDPLIKLAADESQKESLRITAINLLIEMVSDQALPLCLSIVDTRDEYDATADVAADYISAQGQSAVSPMLDKLPDATNAALRTYLDLLCNFPGDERIYTYTAAQFLRDTEHRALYASYLGKLGDERALPLLRQALTLSDLNYLDYIEIRNAIERISGEVITDSRSFEGDPYYESARNA